ncbi:MAG: hypothetical protein ACT4PY_14190 [Armatimonadota bacterium]
MSRFLRGAAVAACLAGLLQAAATEHLSRVWAQAQTPAREGAYRVERRHTKSLGDWEQATIPPSFPRWIYLLRGGEYVWGEGTQAYRSSYRFGTRDTPGGRVNTISLCHRWAGDIRQVDPTTLVLEVSHNSVAQRTEAEFKGTLEQIPLPQNLPEPMKCEARDWPKAANPSREHLALGPQRGPLMASLQTQPGVYRAVNGEFLLTLAAGATQSDTAMWTCVMRRGYPSLEFVEPAATSGGQPQREEVFVWPDARFRARLRDGVTYQWSALASDCGAAQPGATLQHSMPQPVDSEEKVVLACAIGGGRFATCRGWWLVRP